MQTRVRYTSSKLCLTSIQSINKKLPEELYIVGQIVENRDEKLCNIFR